MNEKLTKESIDIDYDNSIVTGQNTSRSRNEKGVLLEQSTTLMR